MAESSILRAFSLFLLAFAASEVFGADTEGDAGSVCGLVSISDYVPYELTGGRDSSDSDILVMILKISIEC
ncbi:hypothetical protein Tco_1493189 [Tanacetum coccineum]